MRRGGRRHDLRWQHESRAPFFRLRRPFEQLQPPPRLEYRMLWISHNHSLSPSVEERVQWGRGRATICVEEIHLPISSRSCAESRTKVYGSIAAAFVGKVRRSSSSSGMLCSAQCHLGSHWTPESRRACMAECVAQSSPVAGFRMRWRMRMLLGASMRRKARKNQSTTGNLLAGPLYPWVDGDILSAG